MLRRLYFATYSEWKSLLFLPPISSKSRLGAHLHFSESVLFCVCLYSEEKEPNKPHWDVLRPPCPPMPPMSSHSHIWAFPSVLSKTYSVLFTIRFCFLATYFFFHTLLEKSPLMLSLLTQLVVPVMTSKWILVLCFQKCF